VFLNIKKTTITINY